MKSKLFITLPILLISIGAMAQNSSIKNTSKKDATITLKPGAEINLTPVEAKKPIIDTMYHLKPVDVFNRAIMLQQAAQLVLRPDDFSANQKKFIIRMADSLSNVDGTWYNGVKGVKKP